MSLTPIIPPNVKLLRHHATSGQIRVIHLYLVRRTRRGHGSRGRGSSGCCSPAGHTVDVYVSTHLSPSEQGGRSGLHMPAEPTSQDHLK